MRHIRFLKTIGTLGWMALCLTVGCGGSGGGGSERTPPESSSKVRNEAPVVSQATAETVGNGVNGVGMNLLTDAHENVIVAPYSLSLSLARLRAGAAGTTWTALNSALNLTGAGPDVDAAFNQMDLSIAGRLAASSGAGQPSSTAAAGWAQARYGYRLSYLDDLVENYGVKPVRVDFVSAFTEAEQTVQNWAFEASGGLSPSISISTDTRLVLGDALRLDAAWAEPFDPTLTEEGWFQLWDDRVVRAPFLRKTSQVPIASGEGYIAVELTLAGGDQRLLVVLPDAGRFDEIRSGLTPEKLGLLAAALAPAVVDLALPRFSLSGGFSPDLYPASARNTADFSGMDGTKDLFVSSAFHRSRLSVDEAGLKAGAATLLALEDAHPETWPGGGGHAGFDLVWVRWPDPAPVLVKLGRPFLFALRDNVTGAVLFLGQVVNPAPGTEVFLESL